MDKNGGNMNQPKGNTPIERAAYKAGYEHGVQEGIQKAILMLQLMSGDTKSFKDSILQNSQDAKKLRELLIE